MQHTRVALLAVMLIALCVAAGQALAAIPNVELMTFLVFVSGFLLGVPLGAVVGACAMAAHSLFNVMGAAILPMLIGQIVCYALIGVVGGLIGPLALRIGSNRIGAIGLGLTGALLAFGYQLVINITSFYTFSGNTDLWPYIWGGIVFSAIQIGWNAALFLLSMRPTLAVLSRYREELQPGK